MVINEGYSNIINAELFSFLKENEFTGLRLKLILFWSRHPQATFNLDSISNILDITHNNLHEPLKDLIEKGMINKHYCNSGIAHYSLNHDHKCSGHIEKLAGMDWSTINLLEGELERATLSV